MNTSRLRRRSSSFCLALLLASAGAHGEIYKWVDADGRTHFSERKDDAGKARPLDLKAAPAPASRPAAAAPDYWQDQERLFRQREAERSAQTPHAPEDTRPRSLSGGRLDETDASKCNYARDILSGALVHRSGAPTDANDRQIAENDIRSYCR
jgi:hypothetical protein